MKFWIVELSIFGFEFYYDDWLGYLFGICEIMCGFFVYGGVDRCGWFLNESFFGVGRVCENYFVDFYIFKFYILLL